MRLPAFEDKEINMRIDGLEVYAINAFLIQRSRPYISMIIYFRPMSLKRYQIMQDHSGGVIDLSPDLNENDISVTLDGKSADILGINRMMEHAVESDQIVKGYLVQVSVPDIESNQEYTKIHIALKIMKRRKREKVAFLEESKRF